MPGRGVAAAGALLVVLTFLAIYLPDIGRGFIHDDFRWIRESRVGALTGVPALFGQNIGFYRPLVSLTFAADHALWGLAPRLYGLTNLGLIAICAALLFGLGRRLGLPAAAALLAAAVWAFNFHGVNMALLWISGRTSILVSVFALATAHAVLARRTRLAGVFCLAALFSKEEAVLLPALFTLFMLADVWTGARSVRLREVATRTWPLWAALGVYMLLRLQSGAFSPMDAPDYYRLSLSPAIVAVHVGHYADRALTVATAASIVLLAAARVRPRFEAHERRALTLAAIWIPATYALTVLVPVRSSLYALLPSIGAALAAGAVASAVHRMTPRAFARATIALLLLVVLLIPVYRSRNVRWVSPALVSTETLRTLEAATAGLSPRPIALVDDPAARFNLVSAFGSLLPDAVALTLGEGWPAEIVRDAEDAPAHALILRFERGRLAGSW
jgi:hypothetical protein